MVGGDGGWLEEVVGVYAKVVKVGSKESRMGDVLLS